MNETEPDNALRCDAEKATNFLLRRIQPPRVHLARIDPIRAGPPVCELFNRARPDGTRLSSDEHADEIRAWIEEWNGRKHWNVYFTLGDVRADLGDAKPRERDVQAVRLLAVDLDPRKVPMEWKGREAEWVTQERARILPSLTSGVPKGVPGPPSLVLDSGGGYWGIWLLGSVYAIEDAEHDIAHAKAHGAHLIALYRAHFGDAKGIVDGVANLERLCRVPFTVNYPDAKKRAEKGRSDQLASILEEHSAERRYLLGQFAPPEGATKAKAGRTRTSGKSKLGDAVKLDSLDGLNVPDFCKVVIAQGCDPDDPGRFGGIPSMFGLPCGNEWKGDRSAAVYYVACEMVRSRLDDDTIRAVLLDEGWPISGHMLDQSNAESCADRQIERAREEVGDDLRRPVIYADPGRLAEIVDEASSALLESKVPIYQRGRELVYPVQLDRSEDEDGVRRERGATVIHPASAAWLTVAMARVADWRRRSSKDPSKDKPTDPLEKHAVAILSQVGSWSFPVLRGIVTAPTLRADGSVLQVPGYDTASRLIFEPSGVEFPPIPERPTRDDAVTALSKFDPLFAGFPFVDENARAVVFSAVLSGLICQVLPAIPLHAFDAPTAGTGKSLLAETVGAIVLGHRPSAMNQGKEEGEDEKRLSTALRAGDAVIWIDNVERVIAGDTLCSILTQELVLLRILGRSEQVKLPCNVLVMATGNNLQIGGDMTRRAVVCRLDSKHERPDQRRFDFNPRDVAAARRVELVVAGLTALRAYRIAERPMPLSPVGSFERWSEWVRETLVWCGYGDPDTTRTGLLADDPKKAELVEILEAWVEAWGSNELTVREAQQSEGLDRLLIEASGKPIWNPRAVGWWLKRNMDRVVAGLVLRRCGESNGTARWCVEGLDGRATPRGTRNERNDRDAAVLG